MWYDLWTLHYVSFSEHELSGHDKVSRTEGHGGTAKLLEETNELQFHTSTLLQHHNSKLPLSPLDDSLGFLASPAPIFFCETSCNRLLSLLLAVERNSNPLSHVLVTVVKRAIWADHRGNEA